MVEIIEAVVFIGELSLRDFALLYGQADQRPANSI